MCLFDCVRLEAPREARWPHKSMHFFVLIWLGLPCLSGPLAKHTYNTLALDVYTMQFTCHPVYIWTTLRLYLSCVLLQWCHLEGLSSETGTCRTRPLNYFGNKEISSRRGTPNKSSLNINHCMSLKCFYKNIVILQFQSSFARNICWPRITLLTSPRLA